MKIINSMAQGDSASGITHAPGATPGMSLYLISYEIKKLNMKGENDHERIR